MTSANNKNVSDEMLMALADGELTGPDASRLLARIKANPDLAIRYALFTDTADALRQAMDLGLVPDHLIATVLANPTGQATATAVNVIPMQPKTKSARRHMVWPLALAASLVLAAGLSLYWGGFEGGRSLAILPDGAEGAALALVDTATGGSIALADRGTARALGSFKTDLGLCRLISTQDGAGRVDRAVVCRAADGGWQTALSVSEGGTGAFRLASDLAVETVDSFLDRIGAGAALSLQDEARTLAR